MHGIPMPLHPNLMTIDVTQVTIGVQRYIHQCGHPRDVSASEGAAYQGQPVGSKKSRFVA